MHHSIFCICFIGVLIIFASYYVILICNTRDDDVIIEVLV